MANTETTTSAEYGWRPDTSVIAAADVVGDALILTCSTVAGQILGDTPALHVAYVDDAAADYVAEGQPIPEADPDLSEVVIYPSKISQLIRLSNELYEQPDTAGQLAQSVSRALVRKADAAFISQAAPTGGATAPSAGLVNVSGIVNGGAVAGDLDTLVDAIADLQANGSTPSHIIVGPQGWAELRKLKQSATANNVSLLGAGTTDAPPMLLSLPVVVNREVSALSGVVIDRSAVVSAVGPVNVAVDNSVFFTSDSVALRATWRIGFNVVRPDRIAKFSVAATGS